MDDLDKFVVGSSLAGGWRVTDIHEIQRDQPNRCRAYKAVHTSGLKGYVKLLSPLAEDVEGMRQYIDEFLYEKTIVELCADRNMRRVVRALSFDKLQVPGIVPVTLHYLIFECGEGDARSLAAKTDADQVQMALQCLHHVATALFELHFSKVTHENVRPASVIRFAAESHKLGDFRQAQMANNPRSGISPSAEATHAAPELLYGKRPESFEERCAIDNYQLGSLGIALITGVGATSHFAHRLDPMHHWLQWRGAFEDVVPYLRPVHEEIIVSLSGSSQVELPEQLITCLKQLTEPDPKKRGYPGNKSDGATRYRLEPYVSIFARLLRKATFANSRRIA